MPLRSRDATINGHTKLKEGQHIKAKDAAFLHPFTGYSEQEPPPHKL